MKRILILCVLGLIIQLLAVKILHAGFPKVEEVVLYPDGVLVIKKGVLFLSGEDNLIDIIPPDVDKSSIFVSINCDAQLLSVGFKKASQTKYYTDLLDKLYKLELVEDELEKRVEFFDLVAASIAQKPFLNPDKVLKSYEVIVKKQVKVIDKLNKVKKSIDELNNRINKEANKVALFVNVRGEDQCELVLSYRGTFARWEPIYSFVLNGNEAALYLKAKVLKKSGGDWNDVDITFSSSKAKAFYRLPPVRPIYIGTQNFKKAVSGGWESTFYSYSIRGANIKSKESTIFLLKSWSWDNVKVHRMLVPCLSKKVFMTVDVKRPQEFLPFGKVELIDGGVLIGFTDIKSIIKKDRLVIPFGYDQGLEVGRTRIYKNISKIWGGKKQLYEKYKISIYNTRDSTVSVTVMEPYPVSTSSDIRVELVAGDFNLKPATVDNGVLKWNIVLQPKGGIDIIYGYKIIYPEEVLIERLF